MDARVASAFASSVLYKMTCQLFFTPRVYSMKLLAPVPTGNNPTGKSAQNMRTTPTLRTASCKKNLKDHSVKSRDMTLRTRINKKKLQNEALLASFTTTACSQSLS
jgi:hypothetical protein